jgi:hypothetical protein
MKSATDSDNLQRLYRDINPRFTERSTARLQNADEPSIAARLRLPSRETAFPSSQSRLSNRSAQYEWLWACPLHPAHLCKGPKTGFIQPPSIDQPVCSPADRQTRLLSARDTAIADSSVAAMSATQVVCFVMTGRDGTGRDGTGHFPSPLLPAPPHPTAHPSLVPVNSGRVQRSAEHGSNARRTQPWAPPTLRALISGAPGFYSRHEQSSFTAALTLTSGFPGLPVKPLHCHLSACRSSSPLPSSVTSSGHCTPKRRLRAQGTPHSDPRTRWTLPAVSTEVSFTFKFGRY